jgi:fatty acid-binding protein DegV
VIIGHCGDLQAGQLLQEEFTRLVPCAQSWCVETGPAVGAHAGPGALVVALQPVPSDAA